MNFCAVPKDEETKIISEATIFVESICILHQVWIWSEIVGESLIFKAADVADYSDEDLKKLLEMTELHTSQGEVTVKNADAGFRFVNFNFREED